MTTLKVFGGFPFGPFCPFRGHRVKSPGQRLIAFLACCGLMTFVAAQGYTIAADAVKDRNDLQQLPVAPWLPWIFVAVGPLTVLLLYGTIFTRAILKVIAIVGLSLLLYHFRPTFTSLPQLSSVTPDWLRTDGVTWLVALTVALLTADLLVTTAIACNAALWPRTPWFAPYSRLSGWHRSAASQKNGPLGIAVIHRDRILAGRVIWLWMETSKQLLRIEPATGEVMIPLTPDNSLQLSNLERPFHLWQARDWRCDLQSSETVTCRWLVPMNLDTVPDVTNLRQQSVASFQAEPLLPENANWYCLHESIAKTRETLGLFVLVDERKPVAFAESPPWKSILRNSEPTHLKLEDLTLDCTLVSEELTVKIGVTPGTARGPTYRLPLTQVSVLLLPGTRRQLQYLFFIPLD